MAVIRFEQVSFTYPEQEHAALHAVSFAVEQGEFVVLCGASGCGKSTLLRHLKPCLAPHGVRTGEILYREKPLADIDARTQAQEIGFVLQSPENQTVTDKVWHELAFGPESLGVEPDTIRRRVAEVAAFFGIEPWFYKNVTELSGGQKQLLSLASVMAMNPKVLVLDEPTAQLDPIAASEFLSLLGKINRELGITVILTEHRLEEVLPFANRVLVMDKGEIVCDDTPDKVGLRLRDTHSGLFLAMPAAMRVWAGVKTTLPCPLTVRDGSEFLTARQRERKLLPLAAAAEHPHGDDVALHCEDVWFRYEKDTADVLKGLSLTLHTGEFYALLGGNGAGKTTALRVMTGLRRAYRGTVRAIGKVGLLPQNPQTLFVKPTVREDLYEALRDTTLSEEQQDQRVARVVTLCGLADILDRHPYDVSGGEQQRTALAKVLLTEPRILLLDEPTKGFDAAFKVAFADMIRTLTAQGVTVLMVSHDVSFCAEYAHRCGLFFDGSIVAQDPPRAFFSGNSFYTTPANRMARHLIPQAVTVEEIIACCGGEVNKTVAPPKDIPPLPKPAPTSDRQPPRPLKWWRKLLAAVAGLAAIGVFAYATSITDLSALVTATGITAAGATYLSVIGALFAALVVLLLALGRKSEPPLTAHTPKKVRLRGRTLAATAAILLLVPLTLWAGVALLNNRHDNLVAIAVLLECMLPFVLVFEGRKPKAEELVTIAVLCAIGIAGRSVFFMLPQFKPVLALTIIAGVALGGETGFLVGAVTMLASNMLFSQGPWTPWQMFAMGIIGFLAGVLFKKGRLRHTRATLAVFGALAALLIYGGIMNSASALMVSPQSVTLNVLLAYYVTGLPMDLIHAASTVLFLLLAAKPMLNKLERIKVKYGLVER